MRLSCLEPDAGHPRRVDAFSWTGFLASLAAGGLLGSVVQQVVQWRRDRALRALEDSRRAEDRGHAVEDARLARQEERYIQVLDSLTNLESTVTSARRAIVSWTSWHAGTFRGLELEVPILASQAGAYRSLTTVVSDMHRAQTEFEGAQQEARDAMHRALSVSSGHVLAGAQAFVGGQLLWTDWMTPQPRHFLLHDFQTQGFPTGLLGTHAAWLDGQLADVLAAAAVVRSQVRAELHLD